MSILSCLLVAAAVLLSEVKMTLSLHVLGRRDWKRRHVPHGKYLDALAEYGFALNEEGYNET